MFFTRIKRGAIRTNILLRTKVERLRWADTVRPRQHFASGSAMRTLAVCTAAAYTAVMPVLPLRAQAASLQSGTSLEDSGEPPSSTPGIQPDSVLAIRLESQVTSSLVIDTDHLADLSVGQSLDDVQQAQEAAQRQQELQQLQQEQAQKAAAAKKRAESAAYSVPSLPSDSSSDVENALEALTDQVFGADQWPAMRTLIMHESGFNPNSYNSRSGACGVFQALPCSKMGGTDVTTQLNWGINYIKNRYGTPDAALAFHNLTGWY